MSQKSVGLFFRKDDRERWSLGSFSLLLLCPLSQFLCIYCWGPRNFRDFLIFPLHFSISSFILFLSPFSFHLFKMQKNDNLLVSAFHRIKFLCLSTFFLPPPPIPMFIFPISFFPDSQAMTYMASPNHKDISVPGVKWWDGTPCTWKWPAY